MAEQGSRGGRRSGAGRRPILSEMERWGVGLWCEETWRSLQQAAIEEKISSIPQLATLERERQRIFDREKNSGPGRGKYAEPLAAYRHRALKRIEVDLGRAFKKALGNRRKFRVRVGRPYGERNKVVGMAVAHFESEYGLGNLTLRFIEQCWKEYRQLKRWLDEQPLSPPQA